MEWRETDMNREQIQQLFIRVCRDSGFSLDWIDAASIAARAANISPLEIWIAFGTMQMMGQVARGEHPAAHR